MTYRFPRQIDQLVRQQMAAGNYASEDELLEDALRALYERNEDLAAIREGIDDMEAGRVEPFLSAAEEIAKKHSF